MINKAAWEAAARTGSAVGPCTAYGCHGNLYCPREPDGRIIPHHARYHGDTDHTITWYEAHCGTCHAVYAYPDGRDGPDADKRERDKKQRGSRSTGAPTAGYTPAEIGSG